MYKLSKLQETFLLRALENLIATNQGRRCSSLPHVLSRQIQREHYLDGSVGQNLWTRFCTSVPRRDIVLRGRYCRRSAQRLIARGMMEQVVSKPLAGYDLLQKGLDHAIELRLARELEAKRLEKVNYPEDNRSVRLCGGISTDVRPLKLAMPSKSSVLR